MPKRLFSLGLSCAALMVLLASADVAYAQGVGQPCGGGNVCNVNLVCQNGVCQNPPPPPPPQINPAFNQLPISGFGIEQVAGLLSIQRIVINILTVTAGSIVMLCTAIFIAGAFMFTISAGDEQRKSLGKDLMIGAVIGLALVVGAKGVLDMTYYFLYGA